MSAPEVRIGMDSEFGVFADLFIPAHHGHVVQGFRWIEPGSFLMGSPDDERERSHDEGPQHAVTLTRGFWLADTACTQALWQAVRGSNPSGFKDDAQCPVERVSWDDVQGFLRKLEEWLPGCGADLPTEAEWEYACRAGSTTSFSFGENITPELVNYDGNYPYAGGERGEFRRKTVPVKSFPPNAWGLYEMHGNVWEWCADGKREYDEKPQRDPVGADGGPALRALRGGSWHDFARRARSAYRHAFPSTFHCLGFRFCLRSIEPGQDPGLLGKR